MYTPGRLLDRLPLQVPADMGSKTSLEESGAPLPAWTLPTQLCSILATTTMMMLMDLVTAKTKHPTLMTQEFSLVCNQNELEKQWRNSEHE
jgi:hypothetical protein